MEDNNNLYSTYNTITIPDGNGGCKPCPALMTEAELIQLLRAPEISRAEDYSNVIANLKRMHDLPRVHLFGGTLYPTQEILKWITEKCIT